MDYLRMLKSLNMQITYSQYGLLAQYYSQISPLILLRYYDDATCVLRKMYLDAKTPHLSSTLPPTLPWNGDQTPKQKVKLNVTEEKLLNLMLKYNGGKPRAETKLKSAVQLQDLLDAARMLVPRIRPGRESDSDPEDLEHAEKLRQGRNFSGIYRKVQLKPLKWDGEGEEERPVEALMILKYGGVLTHTGKKHV
ncbi:hypothetical protein IGI04_002538 [Brassica rapa subsp. trilocularis]|uniref:Uncharacterized protein n=1 Tax=Brassica rapa subsp. trilocularis TaxID=1813537 RepID=A0ABQ7NWL6_BRACM|nr:hypothetical protein IGI04_002538 [Brassica rapa subsp. trilocularis]